ncbi:MAG: DEAD/DEAH box helicase, partial [Acidisphaera sp.]|nr:DEAD/DEAH box helicase [Acidisphaera sp.]
IDRTDPLTQRSGATLPQLVLGPASELVFAEPRPRTPGLEHFLPAELPGLVGVLDLLPDAPLWLDPGAEEVLADRLALIAEARATRVLLNPDAEHGLPPDGLYLDESAWRAASAGRQTLSLQHRDVDELPAFAAERDAEDACAAFVGRERDRGRTVGLAGRRLVRAMAERLPRPPAPVGGWRAMRTAPAGTVAALPADLDGGFVDPAAVIVAAADVWGPRSAPSGGSWPAPTLRPGDAVVDLEHGLAALRGLETVTTEDGPGDCLALGFAGEKRLLVPIGEAARIWRYGADATGVSLDHVGGEAWAARRAEIEAEIGETARGLVARAGERAARTAPIFRPPASRMRRFAAGFPHPPTADQRAAIDAVLQDLASGRPADRLVCGDVGFGKTEVALRAAAAAALCGAQVAVVAPTTVLARQHAETFAGRFARLGIAVGALSRLTPAAEARRVRAGLADGSVAIAIGTQALAGRDVRFRNLGLVVIDEEHRFGARQKAMLGRLREGVHVLTLTATPIPRTLQGALGGLQELSVLATPPLRRQPVRTVATPLDPAAVRAALLRERRRGGQSFAVCPRVQDLAAVRALLGELLPDLGILEAHGELPPDDLDRALLRFARGDGDVLLATDIVEAGLDIPRANTMLVWDADRFGLSQLHQLRGRVGRGAARGMAWLFTDPVRKLTPAAQRRLHALETLDRPGAGFAIAARDLDLRGAGDLLGEAQKGHLRAIGMELYQHLLVRAMRAAEGRDPGEDWTPDMALGVPPHIPPDYVPEEALRLSLHMRLVRGENAGALAEELEDRFGPLPPEVQATLMVARLRRACRRLGVARLDGGPHGIAARMRETPRPIDGLELRDGRYVRAEPTHSAGERLKAAAEVLRAIAHAAG